MQHNGFFTYAATFSTGRATSLIKRDRIVRNIVTIGNPIAKTRSIVSGYSYQLSRIDLPLNQRSLTIEANKLTLLACSGSLIAATLFVTPSHAMPIQGFDDGTPKLDRTAPDQSMQGEDKATPGSYQKRLEQAAFVQFGCSCANCVSATAKLVETGEVSI